MAPALRTTHWDLLRTAGLCLALLCTQAPTAAAQHQFDSWSTENGLPQNSVNDIVQTRDGYLWLATFGGLVRFDGVRFVVFDRSVEGIRSQRITAVHEDRGGTLWAATEDGMLIRYRNGRFDTLSRANQSPDSNAVRIEEDETGTLWVTWLDAITKIDGQRLVEVKPGEWPHRISPPPLSRYLDAWSSQDSAGLHVLAQGRVSTYSIPREWLGAGVTRVWPDRGGILWILTAGGGVVKATGGRLERYTTRNGLLNDHPDGNFYQGRDGTIWYSDSQRLVYRMKDGLRESLNLPGLRAFYVDREGSTWFGTVAAGLHRVRDTTVTVHAHNRGLPEPTYSILEDRTGAVWIGNGGLKKLERGQFTSYGWPTGSSTDRVTSIYEDKAGRLWVGTVNGLTYFDNGRFRRYEDPAGFMSRGVWAMLEDRTGASWFGTDRGLVRSAHGRVTRYTTDDGLPDNRIITLLEDRKGALWIGTVHGLTRLEAGVFTVFAENDGLIGNQVRAIHEDDDGILWVGTYDGGLYRVANGRLTRYTRNDGLHDNGVFQILEDDDGNLWMGSNLGISRISRRQLNEFAEGRRRSIIPVVFDTKDGLTTLEMNGGTQPPGMRAKDGKLWFPTMRGVAVIDPAAVRFATEPPRVIIEDVHVAGRRTDFSPDVRIPPDASSFDVRYTAPTFVKPERVRFRYKLIGLDQDWIDAGDRRTASFHGVRPGNYQFVVTAASAEGVWGSDGPTVTIVVLPPFWRTWWFMSLASIAGATIVVVAHQRRVRRLRAQHAMQAAFSRQLIDSQEGERRRLSSEMHDSLGQHLAIIKRHARVGVEGANGDGTLRETFQDIATVADGISADLKEIATGLRPYQLDAIGLSKTIEGMVARIGRACDIEFDTSIEPIDDVYPQELQIHVYRIVQESVNNIVKHSRARRARVDVTRGAGSVEIRIEDDGVGVGTPSSSAGRPGFGLMGIRERAQILGGAVDIRTGARAGTAVVVTLPLNGAAHG